LDLDEQKDRALEAPLVRQEAETDGELKKNGQTGCDISTAKKTVPVVPSVAKNVPYIGKFQGG
jgi:hypothetical protein